MPKWKATIDSCKDQIGFKHWKNIRVHRQMMTSELPPSPPPLIVWQKSNEQTVFKLFVKIS